LNKIVVKDHTKNNNVTFNLKGLFAYLNTGDGFDNGKQWQSNLGDPDDWKNRPTHENGERSTVFPILITT
jgi:hypothetical protein